MTHTINHSQRVLALAALLLTLLTSIASAEVNDNDSRKQNCGIAGGTLGEVSASTFVCTLQGENSTIASVICTEGKRCTCTGNACPEYGGADAIALSPDDHAGLPDRLRAARELRDAAIADAVAQPETALEGVTTRSADPQIRLRIEYLDGDGSQTVMLDSTFNPDGVLTGATTRSETVSRLMKAAENGGAGAVGWTRCSDKCYHHLEAGEPSKYGVCYWSCIFLESASGIDGGGGLMFER